MTIVVAAALHGRVPQGVAGAMTTVVAPQDAHLVPGNGGAGTGGEGGDVVDGGAGAEVGSAACFKLGMEA